LLTESQSFENRFGLIKDIEIIKKIKENRQEIIEIFKSIPDPITLRELLNKVSEVTLPNQLGIDDELLKRSLKEAHRLRDRCTMLRLLNEL
jgi:glycerol-1-phosphate dehydrogenase [NAD(P)+]